MSREYIIPLQRKANVLLLVSAEGGSGTSGKLYEYLFSGVPILNIGGQNIASRIIDNTGMGKTFSPSDAKRINEYIQQIKAGVFTAKSMNLKQYT